MLVHRTPQQIRFASQLDEHLVKVPHANRLAPYGFQTMTKVLSEFVAPASDRLVRHHHPALEEQLFYVARAQLKAKIPTHGATDDFGRKTMTVVERFRFLHRAILSGQLVNLAMPPGLLNWSQLLSHAESTLTAATRLDSRTCTSVAACDSFAMSRLISASRSFPSVCIRFRAPLKDRSPGAQPKPKLRHRH
jgi:hypothetical protein